VLEGLSNNSFQAVGLKDIKGPPWCHIKNLHAIYHKNQ